MKIKSGNVLTHSTAWFYNFCKLKEIYKRHALVVRELHDLKSDNYTLENCSV